MRARQLGCRSTYVLLDEDQRGGGGCGEGDSNPNEPDHQRDLDAANVEHFGAGGCRQEMIDLRSDGGQPHEEHRSEHDARPQRATLQRAEHRLEEA